MIDAAERRARPQARDGIPEDGYRTSMSDEDEKQPQHNTTGTPNGEQNSEDADTASGGAPEKPDDSGD